ncbi:GMC oxidoreductase [Gordonia sp. NB41Y]|uniref:GMC oxidoreductase n=1 Tax=Gordonia sp. NB41Y TaxID=875808 RepID=UPI0006B21A42|nr:GMC oxidoreductase [Gordonia sp. NB41Y]EMP10846.2 cholesterol oxidase [Gordonia sp. NB41Y]WLP90931.1 GMC oxidoreductase [Gordonia sp. NB41Y]
MNPSLARRALLRGAAGLGVLGATGVGAGALSGPLAMSGAAHAAEGPTAIVIGSGFGGAVAALRLGEAGIRTTVFERGRRWPIRPDGNTFATFTNPDRRAAWFDTSAGISSVGRVPVQPYPGVLETIRGNGLESVHGAGVGGGSLVFGAFTLQPDKDDFTEVFPGGSDYDELARTYYPRARGVLGTSGVPDDILAHPNYVGARSWLKVVSRYGIRPEFVEYAVDWDRVRAELAGRAPAGMSTGDISYGVNSGAKNSVDRNYLPAAERTGFVTIKPMHEVFEIRERSRRPGYVVKARLIDDARRTVRIVTAEADHLFLAAGSFHTTSLLVRARAQGTLPRLSPKIGNGFGGNGDFLIVRTALRDQHGPIQGGPGYARIREERMPGGPATMIYQASPFPAPAGSLATTHLIQVHTDERGTIDYDRSTGGTTLNYPHPAETSVLDRRAIAFAKQFHERTESRFGRPHNGIPIHDRTSGFGSGATFHGLGGVVAGQAATLDGAVKGYDNLYVVDGSFAPGAVGLVNPSLTITALAERTMDRFLGRR